MVLCKVLCKVTVWVLWEWRIPGAHRKNVWFQYIKHIQILHSMMLRKPNYTEDQTRTNCILGTCLNPSTISLPPLTYPVISLSLISLAEKCKLQVSQQNQMKVPIKMLSLQTIKWIVLCSCYLLLHSKLPSNIQLWIRSTMQFLWLRILGQTGLFVSKSLSLDLMCCLEL